MARYWRFAHYPDSAGDTADLMVAHYVADGVTWDCRCCASPNNPDDRFCYWCKAEHGEWVCERCGRRNRKDEECSECGAENPDSE